MKNILMKNNNLIMYILKYLFFKKFSIYNECTFKKDTKTTNLYKD